MIENMNNNSFRTLLFVPGNHEKKIKKALNADVDVVIIDLEDACGNSEKVTARQKIKEYLELPRLSKCYVRVNSISTEYFFEDVHELLSEKVNGIVLPMVEDPQDLIIINYLVSAIEKRKNIAENSIDIIPIIETAKGISNIKSILKEKGRVKRISFGAGDFTHNIGIDMTKNNDLNVLLARQTLVVESRAANMEPPIDTVFIFLDDLEGFAREASHAKSLGFQGKLLIHPTQIDIAKKIFKPSEEEVMAAQKIIEEFEKQEAKGNSAIRINDQFVDYPILYRARKIVEQGSQN